VILLLAVVSPHPDRGTTPIPVPTGLPFKVTVLPRFDDLVALGQANSVLPTVVPADPSALPDLAQSPLPRAWPWCTAAASTLIVVGPNAQRRYENPALAGSSLVPTSLSPAGDRAVLARGADLVVFDVRAATLRVVPADASQPDPPVVVWRDPHTVVVPGPTGAHLVDLDSGTVTVLSAVTGVDVVASEGTLASTPTQLVEMVAISSTVGQSSRIRFWRSTPDVLAAARLVASSLAVALASPAPRVGTAMSRTGRSSVHCGSAPGWGRAGPRRTCSSGPARR
jgi:hypothetical protein